MNLIAVTSRSPWRLTVAVSGTPSLSAGDYEVTREDGLATDIAPARLWLIGINTVEISLSEAMLEGIVYLLTLPNEVGDPTARVAYRQPLNPNAKTEPAPEDVEAEAYGVDTDWISGARSPSGDLNDIRGVACFKNDLVALAIIAPREVYHRPLVGAGLPLDVNGPGTPAELARQRASVVEQWRNDDRVSTASAKTKINTSGEVSIEGSVVDAIAEQVQTVVVGGK